ncbi:MAG: 30S ribosomal protein S4 [Lentisphaeria bacterium]|nr:30S ribosomal protein S4 [Lentisphaeria bacterium]
MPTASQAKHKFCRRIGECLWGCPNCPTVKGKARAFPAGPHGAKNGGRRAKLTTYGELLLEKQKLRNYYAISEKQLRIAYAKAKSGTGQTGDKLFISLETRLDAMVYRAGFAPTIFAAKQMVSHGHILVDGKRVDRSSCRVKEGQVIYESGGDIAPGVALGDNACHLVDPLHQNAAEQAVCAVEVRGTHNVDCFHPGFVHCF